MLECSVMLKCNAMLKRYVMPNCYVIKMLRNAKMLRNTLPCLLLLLSVIRILYKAGVWSRHCKLEFKKHVFPILIKPESKRAPSRHLLLTRSIGNIFRFGSGMPSRNILEGGLPVNKSTNLLFAWAILLVVLALDSRMVSLVAWDQYYLDSTVSLASKQYILFEVFLNQQLEPASGDRM